MTTVSVPDFDLTRGDLLFRLQRRMGLIPADGLGLSRRAVFWTAIAWLPIALWALVTQRTLPASGSEPLFAHFGVHARLLIAVPLLILAEGPAGAQTARLLRQFMAAGLIPESGHAAYVRAVHSAMRWRDAAWPWLVMLAIAVALGTYSQTIARAHEVDWASAPDGLGFGGY
jgi:hypothetical protein